jgi:ATP-dependent DNA helicase DinG
MLTDALKDTIQLAYRRWLESKGLKARRGQRLMIAAVARALADAERTANDGDNSRAPIAVVEAGTGTGKTMAYCVAAIPVAQAREKRLVIATATIALQEQIVFKDLPDLRQHSGLEFSYALAKGRGRYLCLAKFDQTLANQNDFNPTMALYPDEIAAQPDRGTVQVLELMIERLSAGEWDGDRDQWPEQIDDSVWARVTTDHAQCTGRRCPHVRQCSFFKARDNLDKIDIVVTNHDLVLADLALGGGVILPDPAETFYIFDEGHHLPDKARDHFAYSCRLRATDKWLEQSIKILANAAGELGAVDKIGRQLEVMPSMIHEARQALASVRPGLDELLASVESNAEQRRDNRRDQQRERLPHFRFEHGVVPDELRVQAELLHTAFEEFAERLGRVASAIESELDDDGGAIEREIAERWLPAFSMLRARAQANRELWFYYARDTQDEQPPRARWIIAVENTGGALDLELHCSPILAAGALVNHLWTQCAGAVVTSATLTALGKFERFAMRSGVPNDAIFEVVPSPFDHATAAVLSVPPMSADPSDPQQHTDMLVQMLPELLSSSEGSLVLFSSRKQMEQVFAALPADWQQRIFMQDTMSKQEVLNRHRERIDGGAGSVIFGLASFSEGVDLPGKYCSHVVIAKIPFAVPDEPVEAALAEWIEARGGNSFMEMSVPDAALKLVQASGRLLRTESDRGRITLLDRRIVSKRYGRAILDSLPPFRRDINR